MSHFPEERRIEALQLEERSKEILRTVYSDRHPIGKIERCVTGVDKGPERAPKKGWEPFAVRTRWGGFDQTTWFRMTARIPKAWKGREVVALIRPAAHTHIEGLETLTEGGDSLCFVDGVPKQGIDRNHEEVLLTPKAKGDESFCIEIESCPSARFDTTHEFEYADLAVRYNAPWQFYWDLRIPLDTYYELDPDTATAQRLLETLVQAMRRVDLQRLGESAYFKSLGKASRWLRNALKAFPANPGDGRLVLAGHSHIDTAWLWPLRETRRKVGRTFSTVLDLMDRYPEYHFSCSQPELYMYVKEHFPELWPRIESRVKQGRWELCGAPWIEQDNNMPSGESLVRQFLYGNRFFEAEFGMRSNVAWLPDAFGYPWSLPQILRQCQIETFVTTKIDWNLFTKFPYSYFDWQGVDGTKIRAAMPPLNYNGNPVPKDLRAQWQLFKQKNIVDEVPFPFGYGDGGGGPTAAMLEQGRRARDLVGLPRCEFGRIQDALERMAAQTSERPVPVYNDELYLEIHRACQTTQARTKKHNRQCEVLLHNAEMLASIAARDGLKYDRAALWKAWRIVLTNQFHDILPGSSIAEVYAQTERDYAEARAQAERVLNTAVEHLVARTDTSGPGTPVAVFNTLSWPRSEVVAVRMKLPRGDVRVVAPDGAVVPSQRVESGELLFRVDAVPPCGWAVYRVVSGAAEPKSTHNLKAATGRLENAFVRVALNRNGEFTQVFDKQAQRDVLAPGERGNILQLFDDRPHWSDAWDIDHNFEDEAQWQPGKAESVELVESGPLRATVRVVRRTERSVFTQHIRLYADSPRIEVELHADWQENHALLKVAFPVDILSPRATYDIQYATIERPTHHSTKHDRARFEVAAHQWADLSEGDYGVSLLNDCKYGYDIRDNVMRLSLLRAPADPDPHADRGEHTMTYALYPHRGDWRCDTVQRAAALNAPMIARAVQAAKGARGSVDCFAALDVEHVILDTIKVHEDSDDLIVRLYEKYGQRGPATLTLRDRPKRVTACDMMEENDTPCEVDGHSVALYFTPYEIKTLRISP